MKRFSAFVIYILLIALASCVKDDKLTDDELARDDLYKIMKEYYLWDKLMPEVKKENYRDPYELLEGVRYRKLDRWSYVQDYDEFERQSNAIFVGHGISIGLDNDNRTRIAQIYNKAQLYTKGVRRGWIIKKINDVNLAPIFIDKDWKAYEALMGASKEGVTNKFLFETPTGKDSLITDTKSTFTLNTVIYCDTLHLKTGVTGYLVFDQFVKPSNAELETAFAFFSRNYINNIIVDLRYNGGGDVTVLQNLAAHIAGPSLFGKPFLKMTHNEQQKKMDKTLNFASVTSSVNVSKMVVITTRGTASASEDLINGLKPFMEVKTIGDLTNGKPVGMYAFRHKTKYYFVPITFTLLNTKDESDFYDGFAPEKYVHDDITYDWGNRNEACLKEAINLLENGSILARSGFIFHQTLIFSEGSKKPDNAYLIEK
jgi:C-terminal processing protease CtpA/Prc